MTAPWYTWGSKATNDAKSADLKDLTLSPDVPVPASFSLETAGWAELTDKHLPSTQHLQSSWK